MKTEMQTSDRVLIVKAGPVDVIIRNDNDDVSVELWPSVRYGASGDPLATASADKSTAQKRVISDLEAREANHPLSARNIAKMMAR